MIMWPIILIVIGAYLLGVGMYEYLQGKNERLFGIKRWPMNLALGIINFGIGFFILIDLNT